MMENGEKQEILLKKPEARNVICVPDKLLTHIQAANPLIKLENFTAADSIFCSLWC